MAQIIIDTNCIWKSIKIPLTVAGILILIAVAAFAGYCAGKSSHNNAIFNITPIPGFTVQNFTVDGTSLAPDSMYIFSDQISNHTINVTLKKSFCSKLTFTDDNFKSPSVQYFNDGNLIPAGTYTLYVTGWNSQWSVDEGWWEEGVTNTKFKSSAWGNMTHLWVRGKTTPLSTIINGEFAYENSTGSATVTLSSPSQVGIKIIDNPPSDNRGSAIFVFSDANDTTCMPF
jgi:hypothetical protein